MSFQRLKFTAFLYLAFVSTLTVAASANAVSIVGGYVEVRNLEISYTLSSTTGRSESYEISESSASSLAEVDVSGDGLNFETVLSQDSVSGLDSSAVANYSNPDFTSIMQSRSFTSPLGHGTFPGPLFQRSSGGSVAGEVADLGIAIQESFSLAYSDSYITLVLSGPGDLTISMPYELVYGYQATTGFDEWAASAVANLFVYSNDDSIFAGSDVLSAEGIGPILDNSNRTGNYLFELNTAELFLESQGLPVQLVIYVGTNFYSHALHHPVSDVPEPTSLALLGLGAVLGRRRFRKA